MQFERGNRSGRSRRGTGWVMAACVASACTPPADAPTTDRPTLRLIDSIRLEETDSSFLSDPGPYFLVDRTGRMYIPDEASRRVQRYRPNGELDLTFGRRGQGPGEFGFVGPAVLVVDTMLLVEANFQRRIYVFSTVSGKFLYSVPFVGVDLTGGAATGDKLLWGHFDRVGRYSVMIASSDSVLRGPIANAPPLRSSQHPHPEAFRTYPHLDRFNLVPLVAWADTVVFGYAATDWLVRAAIDGTPLDTVIVPVARRLGVTAEGLERFRARNFKVEDAYGAISATYALWRASTGEIVVWHQDGSIEVPAPNRMRITGTAWISLLSADLTRACVDAEVTTPGTDRPRLALKGDTLYVLDQVLDSDAGSGIRSIIRRYHLSSRGCNWLPIERRK